MSVGASLKRLMNTLLRRVGHVVAHESVVPSFDRLARLLDAHGLTPRMVVDVGVADGTPWLYQRFPDAFFVLVDPTREAMPHMQRWVASFRGGGRVEAVALGETEGLLPIRVRTDGIGASSFFGEVGPHALAAVYDVPVRRFDQVISAVERPCLVKIDVQGAELMVLRGMGDRVRDIDCIIVETSLIRTLEGDAPEFWDVAAAMHERGFLLYDIIGINRRPLDQALAQLDAVFVPASSPLRQDRRWQA